MRVVVASAGSTGDLMPLTGVAAELVRRGHSVVMTAQTDVAEHVTAAGIEVAVLPGAARVVQDVVPGAGLAGHLRMLAWMNEQGRLQVEPMTRALVGVLEGADAVVFSPLMLFGLHVAEALGIPSLGLYLQPITPTRRYLPSPVGIGSLGPLNRIVGDLFVDAIPKDHWPFVERLRAELGLEPARTPAAHRQAVMDSGWQILQGFSRHVVPHADDLPGTVRTVGFCWPARTPWSPSEDLVDFLAAGPRPVVVGFGSAPVVDPAAMRESILAAGRRAGVRMVVQAGWAELGDVGARSDDVFVAGHVPHEWLLPHAAAMVHACGAGTTAAAVRAGVPAVGVPVMNDQPFWARRLHALGVAPRPIPITRLTTDRLARALREVTEDESYGRAARALAAEVATEDGVGTVADAVEALRPAV